MKRLLAAALGAAICSWLFAQAAPEPLRFEVVSIKPTPPDTPGSLLQLQPGGTLRVTNSRRNNCSHSVTRFATSKSAAGRRGSIPNATAFRAAPNTPPVCLPPTTSYAV